MSARIPATPVVSLLLPCRDAEPFLPECIRSLESQTLERYEVLAVDDDSTDRTAEILSEWASRDPRVRVIRTGGETGLVPALNLASASASAPLLGRMDADDVALPRRLELQADLLESHRDVAACGTGVELFPARHVGEGYARYAAWLNGLCHPDDVWRDLLVECPIAHPALLIRRSALRAIGGYRDAGWPEDYDLMLRLHAAGMRASNHPERLLRWRVRPDRHSLASDRYGPDSFRRCKVHFLRESFLPSGRPLVVWGAGRVGKPLARELLRQGSCVDAFVDLDPRKIGQEIHGAPVLNPEAFARRPAHPRPYVLAAVGSPGARDDIRAALDARGFREIDDYRVCA
jgi:glycosyltransferase involved in cell wall biosynthesis